MANWKIASFKKYGLKFLIQWIIFFKVWRTPGSISSQPFGGLVSAIKVAEVGGSETQYHRSWAFSHELWPDLVPQADQFASGRISYFERRRFMYSKHPDLHSGTNTLHWSKIAKRSFLWFSQIFKQCLRQILTIVGFFPEIQTFLCFFWCSRETSLGSCCLIRHVSRLSKSRSCVGLVLA